MGRSWPTLIVAWVLLSVTMVGFETIFVFWICCSALSTRLNCEAEKTDVSARSVAAVLAIELSRLSALSAVSVRELLVPFAPVVVVVLVGEPFVPVVDVFVGVPLVEVTLAVLVEPLVCAF